jgi:putative ABC transport system permease protein
MLANYLKIAWRNLTRNKIYSFINISGLAIGLAACMLILLYVGHESSYDQFHANAKNIYWIQGKIMMGSDSVFIASMSYPTATIAKQNEPSVESFLRLKQQRENTIISNSENQDLKFSESKFVFADSNFFNFFSFSLSAGNKNQVLQKPFSVVITEKTARKFFGDSDPVGKILRYNNSYNFTVTGVADKAPSNSSIDFDFIASLSSISSIDDEKKSTESQILEPGNFKTYFQLKNGISPSKLEASLLQLHRKTSGPDAADKSSYIATPISSTHTQANYADYSNVKYMKLFPLVAGLVLLLALINYVNLSTARATTRAKEIGVRKVIGAGRKGIAIQFFIESAVFTSIAFALGFMICAFFQPSFFNFLQIDLDNSFLYSPAMLISFAALFLLAVILSATYPSILLSAYKPVLTLYGRINKNASTISLRKFFTVFQFTVSVILIIAGLIINQQLIYFRNTDTGLNRENIVMVPFTSAAGQYYASFRKEVEAIPAIQQVTTSQSAMYKGNDIMGATPKGSDKMIFLPILSVDENFMSTLNLKWKTPPANGALLQQNKPVILNETAVEKLNLGAAPINEKVDELSVAGVLKDFNYYSLRHKISALGLIIVTDRDTASRWKTSGGCLFAKLRPHVNTPSTIAQIKTIYQKYEPAKPFEFSFMDEAFDDMYKAETKLAKILGVFTILTILIACLGLLGLSTFMVLQRTKEIGIRKVLGATTTQLATLLSKDFIILVAISIVIASPVAWWAMNKWLQDFAYRINIDWTTFMIAGIAAVLIAIITVSFQAIKAAVANPVKSLRSE